MRNFIKVLAALSLSLAAANTAHAVRMSNWQRTEHGFRQHDPLTGHWGPEYPFGIVITNQDHSAAIVEINRGLAVMKLANNRLLNDPVSRGHRQTFGFSKSGNLAHLYDRQHDTTIIVDIANERVFEMIGTGVHYDSFSDDERFVVVQQLINGDTYQTIFGTEKQGKIASMPGGGAIAVPHSSNMLVSPYHAHLDNPVLIDMTTGKQIGQRLAGSVAEFSPNGQFVVLQQNDQSPCGNPHVAFYSTATSALVKTVPGVFEDFLTGPDLIALLRYPDSLSAIGPTT